MDARRVVAARVAALAEAIPAASRGRITMAAALAMDSNEQTTMLIATSEPRGYLWPGVALEPDDSLVTGIRHAEQDIVDHVKQNEMKLLAIGATRPICPDCARAIERTGAAFVTEVRT